MTKKSLEATIDGLLDFGKNESREQFQHIAQLPEAIKAVEAVKTGNYDHLYFSLIFPLSQAVDGLILSVTDNERLLFLMKHSQFVERHIETLFEKLEGAPYSADKARTVMGSLIHKHMAGKPIVFNDDQKYTFHLPKVVLRKEEDIVEFGEALEALYYGNSTQYLNFMAQKLPLYKAALMQKEP